ncbi:MAG: hypothetical protein PHC61_01595, partial [Chitinivibrionales bacterium]|nr:hypothetical protein [Chitinivibrionales bacterium]
VLWLLDIRHIGLAADRQAFAWLRERQLPSLPILTKCDKLSKSAVREQRKLFARCFKTERTPLTYSIQENAARERFWEEYARFYQAVATSARRV